MLSAARGGQTPDSGAPRVCGGLVLVQTVHAPSLRGITDNENNFNKINNSIIN